MMGKFVNLEDDRILEVVNLLGKKTSINEGLDIAKALINNYFEEDEDANEILDLIHKKVKQKKINKK